MAVLGSPELDPDEVGCEVTSSYPLLGVLLDQGFSFSPGIEITELEPVKGLEFDYVILVDVNAQHFPDTPRARRALHVAATRGIHQLWAISTDRPSPLLPATSPETGS